MASYAFRVSGIEPRTDLAWIAASEADHRAFWQAVVGFVLAAKDKELADGLDRFGKPLIPIAESTRAKGRWRSHTGMGSADAPPLDPAYRLSRTRSLFRGRAHKDHAEFFWATDVVTGLPGGKVLGWHRGDVAKRPGRNASRLPVRDVIGLSLASLARVKAQSATWWANHKAGAKQQEKEVIFKFAQAETKPEVTGNLDLDRYTFGIGADRDTVAAMIAKGQFSGFSKAGPWKGPRGPAAQTPLVPRVPQGPVVKVAALKPLVPKPPKDPFAALAEERAKQAAQAEAQRQAAEAEDRANIGKPIDRAAVLKRIERKGINETYDAVSEMIRQRSEPGTTTGVHHGMTSPETFRTVAFEGIRFHYDPASVAESIKKTGKLPPITGLIRQLAAVPAIHPEIAKHTTDVYFTAQANEADERWKQRYHDPAFVSLATAGGPSKDVVAYADRLINAGSLFHEMGHNWAHSLWGEHMAPPIGSDYWFATKSGEPPVTEYAAYNLAEDFAEAVELFSRDPAEMRKIAPKRYQAIKDLLDGKP